MECREPWVGVQGPFLPPPCIRECQQSSPAVMMFLQVGTDDLTKMVAVLLDIAIQQLLLQQYNPLRRQGHLLHLLG